MAIVSGVVRESDVNDGAAVTDTIGCAGLGVEMTIFDPAASDVTCGGMTATAELHTPVTVTLPDVYVVSATLTYPFDPRLTVSDPEFVSVLV